MEGFITLDMFLNFAFCVTATAILVQLIKTKFTKIDTWIVLLIISTIVMSISFFVKADYTWQGLLTSIVNIFVVAISASGSYEAIKKVAKKTKSKISNK